MRRTLSYSPSKRAGVGRPMPTARDAVRRQWALLKEIPRAPGSIGTSALLVRLKEQGYVVNVRTIQRDLITLATVFPLSSSEEGRASRWFWSEAAKVVDVPGLDVSTALAFQLAREYLQPLLPQVVHRRLAGHFQRAEECLSRQTTNQLSLWPDKVCVISRGPALRPPPINAAVQMAVEQALLHERQLQLVYRSKHDDQPKRYVAHPCGLVSRDGVFYLIATLRDYPDLRHLALHRISIAEVMRDRAKRPSGFTLKKYVAEEQLFSYPTQGGLIHLDVLLEAKTAIHLRERPLARNQRLTTMTEDGRTRLRATLRDTHELRWWLLGFGDKIEVLGPKSLRKEFADIARRMAKRYQNTQSEAHVL